MATSQLLGLNLHSTSAVIDIALAVAAEGRSLSDIADALHLLDRENDEMLWAAMSELARLVGEGDDDGQIWAWAVRNRHLICGQAQRARTEHQKELEVKADSGPPDQHVLSRRNGSNTIMTNASTPWWEVISLRDEVTSSGGAIDDVQMSLHNAVFGKEGVGAGRTPYSECGLLRQHHPPDRQPRGVDGAGSGSARCARIDTNERDVAARSSHGRR